MSASGALASVAFPPCLNHVLVAHNTASLSRSIRESSNLQHPDPIFPALQFITAKNRSLKLVSSQSFYQCPSSSLVPDRSYAYPWPDSCFEIFLSRKKYWPSFTCPRRVSPQASPLDLTQSGMLMVFPIAASRDADAFRENFSRGAFFDSVSFSHLPHM